MTQSNSHYYIMLNASFLQNTTYKILVIKIHQSNVKIQFHWPNRITAYFLKVSLSFQSRSQQKLLGFGIWHSERKVLTSVSGRAALDCTKSSWNCCSLGLLWETCKKQMLDVQHLAALADAELRQRKTTPARESVSPNGKAASQCFLSLAHRHHSLPQAENSVLWQRQLISNQLLSVSSPFADTFFSKSGDMFTLERRGCILWHIPSLPALTGRYKKIHSEWVFN